MFALAQAPDRDEWRVGIVSTDGSGSAIETGPVFIGSRQTYGWSPDGSVVIVSDAERGESWVLDANGGAGRRGDWMDPSGEPPAWQRLAP